MKHEPKREETFAAELPVLKTRRKLPRQFDETRFSGGGIRSAAFGLGVLEDLKQINRLEQFD